MKYKLVIFDMDGTILDTLDDLADSLNYALRQSGLQECSLSDVRCFVGNGIQKLIDRAVSPDTPLEVRNQVHLDFTEYYRMHCSDQTKAYEGIPAVLAALKEMHVKMSVVSNKPDYAVQKLCEQYFDGFFDFAVGARPNVRKKPAPDSIYTVLEQLKTEKKDAVYVGDSEVDIQTARHADIDCISVGWGYRDEEVLRENGAAEIVREPLEIISAIR
ncbi:MAG: HAD family hydrolase [Clostridiales bacterium]|nr:HAD family hydrolase [Clostridiales bacterium]